MRGTGGGVLVTIATGENGKLQSGKKQHGLRFGIEVGSSFAHLPPSPAAKQRTQTAHTKSSSSFGTSGKGRYASCVPGDARADPGGLLSFAGRPMPAIAGSHQSSRRTRFPGQGDIRADEISGKAISEGFSREWAAPL